MPRSVGHSPLQGRKRALFHCQSPPSMQSGCRCNLVIGPTFLVRDRQCTLASKSVTRQVESRIYLDVVNSPQEPAESNRSIPSIRVSNALVRHYWRS